MTILIQAADHPITSVTVFKSSKAEVVRTFSLSLPKGQTKVDISGLSSTIDPLSVRISGLGDARLLDIVTTLKNSGVEGVSPTSSAEVIRTLEEKITDLRSAIAVRHQESMFLTKYGETLTGEHLNLDQLKEFLTIYSNCAKKRLEESVNNREEILKLQGRLVTEREKALSKRGTARGHVDAVLFTDTDTRIEMTLTYIVSNTTWKPTYELHATTESGKPSSAVILHYRARVNQSTGEDWSNTTLTLSTVSSDTVTRQIPHLRPVKLGKKVKQTNVGQLVFTQQQQQQRHQQPQPRKRAVCFSSAFSLHGRPELAPSPFIPILQEEYGIPTGVFSPRSVSPANSGARNVGPGTGNASPFRHDYREQPKQLVYTPQQQHKQPQPYPITVPYSLYGRPGLAPQSSTPFGSTTLGDGCGIPTEDAPYDTVSSAAFPPRSVSPTSPGAHNEAEEFEQIIDGQDSAPITIVTETPMAASFSVNDKSNIPSDGVDHQVSVAVLPFLAKISYIAIPRIEPRVFLQCEVKNTSEYRLLPGPVMVILDNNYVSRTSINDVNTGDDFECTLGDDAFAKVTYERTSKTVKSDGGTFSEVTNTCTYTTKISIHNKHQFPIDDLIVRDVIPTCEDKRLKIVLLKPEGLADAKDGEWVDVTDDGLRVGWEKLVDGKGGEKEGRFEWRWKVDIGAKANLHAEWEVKAPGEVAWVEMS